MLVNSEVYRLFRQGSRTYFFSSLFFPPEVRRDVFALYAFVRKADNFVDCVPQDKDGFIAFRCAYEAAKGGTISADPVIDGFLTLSNKKNFDPAWIDAFLNAMQQDLHTKEYETLDQCIGYMYGSAEVVGLLMARLLGLPEESLIHARMLGRAMQYINFIRDIAEDAELGRVYLPKTDRLLFDLPILSRATLDANPEAFQAFLEQQIRRYEEWQNSAEEGFHYLPRRIRIPVATASEMYKWTGRRILKNPALVFNGKVKPTVPRIVLMAGYKALTC